MQDPKCGDSKILLYWFIRLSAGFRVLVGGLLALLAVVPLLVLHAQTTTPSPSSDPLLNRDGGGVKPNVVLTIDDSGSMWFQHMPDSLVYLGNSPTASVSPVQTVSLAGGFNGSHSIRMHPSDTLVLSSVEAGAVAGSTTSGNWQQAFLRSSETNTIYYNPEVRYKPWVRPDATRMPDATVTAAPIDPTNFAGTKVNLATITSINTEWCAAPGKTYACSSGVMASASFSLKFNPMLYYRLQKNGDGSYKAPNTTASFTLYDLNPVTATGAPLASSSWPTFTKYFARTDCTGTSTCTMTEERQNFANWFTYYRARHLLAKGGLSESFVDGSNTFRLGYGRINKTTASSIDGVNTTVIESGVRDFTTARRSTTIAWLQALPIGGGTPLRDSMNAVGQYYMRGDNGGPWSDDPAAGSTAAHKSCRRAYHFMVTDGYWNDSPSSLVGNVDANPYVTITGPNGRVFTYTPVKPYSDNNANMLADYAMYYWRSDLRGSTGTTALDNNISPSADNPAFWQSMSNFIIGLGVRGTLNPATDLPSLQSGTKTWGTDRIDDLWHAALNSRGTYVSVKDTTELSNAIKNSLSTAVERELKEAGVATAAATLQDGNRKYVPSFRTSAWNGDVQAYDLDSNGQTGPSQWNAESRLPAWASRNIVTWDTGPSTPVAISFTWSAMSLSSKSALGTITATYTSTFIDFLRGDRSNESIGASLPFRARDGVIGDFINSTPVFVKDSFNGNYAGLTTGGGSSYATFLAGKSSRTGVLFVGSNAGMLHGFQDPKSVTPSENGKEVFAYVPRAVYPSLSVLVTKTYGTSANYHKFMVDGGLKEGDAWVIPPTGGAKEWRSYLVGSTGAGARAVFALDVTNVPNLDKSAVRWERSNADDGDIGYVMAAPEIGVLPNGEWVVIFGNGYFSDTQQAKLMVLKVSDGTIMKLPVGVAGSNGLGGVGLLRNDKGEITRIYAGDLNGKVWRFDYDSTASSTGWFKVGLSGNALFSATASSGTVTVQPITQAPAIYPHTDAAGGYLVVFGTGKLLTSTDADSTALQSLYGVWDKPGDVPPVSSGALKARTLASVTGAGSATFYTISGTDIDWSGTDRGWIIDMSIISGLRTVYPPLAVSSKVVLMSAVAPAANVAICETGVGRGVNLLFDVFTGKPSAYPVYDTNGDGVINSSDSASSAGYATDADGQDAILHGTTTYKNDEGRDCRKLSIQNTTSGQLGQLCGELPPSGGGATGISDRVWRRIINPPIR